MDAKMMVSYILDTFPGVETSEAFGYVFFFHADERMLPFATLASSDNDHDRVSNLDRPGVYRLNIGISRETFQVLFGESKVDIGSHDFTVLDKIMPHPEYAAQNFVCVLNPKETWEAVQALLAEAHDLAVRRYERRRPNGASGTDDSA